MNNSLYSSEYSTALAIVGMAGRFPGASSLEQFWQNIASKASLVRQYSGEELLAAGVKPEDLRQPDYVKAGAILENIEYFDTSFFGFNPREAELLDPQFRIFLECVWEALEVAGYDLTTFDGLIGVFAGAGYKNYLRHHINKTPGISEAVSEFQLSLGQETDVLATMVSYKLNLKGPSVSVQSFCSTSLVAVHLACQSLLNYECDIAVAGGVALNSLQMKGYFYEEGKFVSPDGLCRPFDARTQGSVLSNGAATVALKRLQEALDDGDQIYAIIRGSAMNNDGNQRVSYTAPGLDGQASVIASALSYAGVHPETISYIEANGTGTRLGDAIELAAMIKAFSGKTRKERFCALGSLKPNIGHLDRASGVAGLIKTTLALNHRQLPPHLYYEVPNPEVDLRHSPFYINTGLVPWPGQQTPRRAGINSFGLGGTNVHLVLEEAPEREAGAPARTWQVLPLSAKSEWSLQQANSNLVAHLKAHPEQSLADVAYTLQVGRNAFSYRQFVIARTTEEACAAMEQHQVLSIHQERRDRAVAFLFPGTGKHSISMARNLYRQEPHFRETVTRCCRFLQTHVNLDLRDLLAPEQEISGAVEMTTDTLLERGQTSDQVSADQIEVIQPVIFIVEYALARLLMEWNIRPQAMLGYGPGEYVAACLAGVLSLEDALTVVARGARLSARQSEAGKSLSSLLHSVTWHEPQMQYISSVTGTWITKGQATDPGYWARQMSQPIDPGRGVDLLLREPGPVPLEVGADCASEQRPQIISLSTQRFDQADLLLAIGRLWLAGVTIDWKHLSGGGRRLRVALPTYAFERQRCWIDDPDNLNVIRQRAVAARKKEIDVADWFYLPYWDPAFPPALPRKLSHPRSEHHCMVFVDSSGIGTQVAQKLAQEGCPVVTVEAGDAFVRRGDNHFVLRPEAGSDYVALFNELSRKERIPRTILHCWNVTPDEKTPFRPEYLNPRLHMGFASLLCLARAIGSSLCEAEIQLVVVSNHVQAVTGEELLCPEKAPVLGLCKVITQEYPNIICQRIDVGTLEATGWAHTSFVENLAAECLVAPTDLVVAYRGYTRWAQKYSPVRLTQVETAFRTRGVYLIVGGLGEVGLILAEYLATRMQARIVLIDESSFPPKDQWPSWVVDHPQDDPVSQTIQRLQELEARNAQIWVLQTDLADAEQMKRIVERIRQHFGDLHGVFHLAGSSDLQTIQDMDQASYNAHFRPKLHSLYALKQALQDTSLDFCLLFSSLTAVLGGLGCTIEAAISMFTDAFVFKENQTSPTLWMSVNWDLWHTRENEHKFLGTAVSRYMMSPEEGTEALSRIIASRWIRMINSTGNLPNRFEQLEQSLSESAFHHKPAAEDGIRPKISTEYVSPENPIERKIVEVWQDLLGVEQIGIYDNFFELHGHSLLGMQLIARLRQLFQVNISLIKLFEGPTIAQLAEVVEALMIEEIEKLGEEEAQLLI